jgi:hypothetical protein
LSSTFAFTAADTVALGVYQTSGAPLAIDVTGETPQMAMTWVGRTA